MMFTQLCQPVLGSNTKLLDLKADIFESKISSKTPISAKSIRESLTFINDPDKISPKYSSSEEFEKLYSDYTQKIHDQNFITFASLCRDIYLEDDRLSKSAVHILFEEVGKRAQKYFEQLKKLKEFKEKTEEQNNTGMNLSSVVDYFLNMDKGGIKTH